MKLLKFLSVFVLAGLFLMGCEDELRNSDLVQGDQEMLLKTVTGNGSLSGPHYELNLIGVDNAKDATMDSNNGHRIFVWLNDYSKIELIEGDDFAVLDANATDGSAQFQLPNPDLDPYNISDPGDADTESAYTVFIRPLGKPGGLMNITTCAELMDTDFAGLLSGKFLRTLNRAGYFGGLASVESVALALPIGSKGKPRFQNVTAELLTIVFKVVVDIDPDPEVVVELIEYIRVPIFSDIIDGEYWEIDNNGLKLAKLRFYPGVSTDVTYADDEWK